MATNSINEIICSGGFILAVDTKRFLFLLRNNLKTSGQWGFVGGRKEPVDTTPFDTLTREINEEIGLPKIKKTIPLELFVSNDSRFQYNTYVILVESEFIPVLNNEHSGYAWCQYGKWPRPLHNGVKHSLNNKITRAKIELLLDLI